MAAEPSQGELRRHAVARTLFPPTTLARAIARLGFVQADPIRAPARAQDLTLRHRVRGYRAGDLERRYPELAVEEEYFLNYGFLPREHLALMHPRTPRRPWDRATQRRADEVLAFVRERDEVHPRAVDERFAHGRVKNYWGGSSSATTQLLDGMHYRGLLRVVRRDAGVRVYAARESPVRADDAGDDPRQRRARADRLLALAVAKYAPVPAPSLRSLARMLRLGAPQLARELSEAATRMQGELPHVRIQGVEWCWPEGEHPRTFAVDDAVRLLAPFDPIVWDRRRFELLWGWAYRFEAYTPAAKRKLGYYALPLLFRDRILGWANASLAADEVTLDVGFAAGRPRDGSFRRALDEEAERVRAFLGAQRVIVTYRRE